jgi:hypothetical protein
MHDVGLDQLMQVIKGHSADGGASVIGRLWMRSTAAAAAAAAAGRGVVLLINLPAPGGTYPGQLTACSAASYSTTTTLFPVPLPPSIGFLACVIQHHQPFSQLSL